MGRDGFNSLTSIRQRTPAHVHVRGTISFQRLHSSSVSPDITACYLYLFLIKSLIFLHIWGEAVTTPPGAAMIGYLESIILRIEGNDWLNCFEYWMCIVRSRLLLCELLIVSGSTLSWPSKNIFMGE